MSGNNAEWLIGSEDVAVKPVMPYSDEIIHFLNDLSLELRKEAVKSGYSDLMSLSFWCRKGNLLKLKENAGYLKNSIGRGLVFHITPANVPVNFAFSWFFGLLAGNANIVRVPTKDFPQIKIILAATKRLFGKTEYDGIKDKTAFVRYGHDKEITDRLSAKADGRMIWGGDRTISEIRQSPIKPKCMEIVFADRYSIGILNTEAIMDTSDRDCRELARGFYNDTYLMDQNACSTPHILFWTESIHIKQAKKKFWDAVFKEAQSYNLEPIKSVDKYTDLCMAACQGELRIKKVDKWENFLYTIDLAELPSDICRLRGRYGMFYQHTIKDISCLAPYISERVQTLLYYGLDRGKLFDFVETSHLTGIDRIVPFGSSLNMNPYWDGYDIIGQLSRRVLFE